MTVKLQIAPIVAPVVHPGTPRFDWYAPLVAFKVRPMVEFVPGSTMLIFREAAGLTGTKV
jgi:hypothetical protein